MTAYKFEVVRMALRASLVTRHAGLVVHPSVEHKYENDEGWGVSAECGLSLGHFSSRGSAEMYAGLVAKIADWTQCPSSVEEASAWANRFTVDQRAAVSDALVAAREAAAKPMPWED